MNVFLCCFQSRHVLDVAPYQFWLDTFKPTLEAAGHTVLEPEGLDFVEPLARRFERSWLRRYRERASEELVRQVRKAHTRFGVDLFFSYFYGVHVFPDAIQEIRRYGIPAVNFFCDNLREFHSVEELVDAYTLNWVPERDACGLYRSRGAAFAHIPFGGIPDRRREPDGPELPQVTFVGSADGLRARLAADVLRREVPLQVFGRGWVPRPPSPLRHSTVRTRWRRVRKSLYQHAERLRHFGLTAELRHLRHREPVSAALPHEFARALHGGVDLEALLQLAARSAVFLGVNRCPHPGYPVKAPLVYSRLRDIEGPMMGACYLTEYCPELEDLYEVGAEIAVYRDVEELTAEATRLLGDANARRGLRERGSRAAAARHSWTHRFEKLFRHLGMSTNAA